MALLEGEDLAEIAAVARAMAVEVAVRGRPPLSLVTPPKIAGATLRLDGRTNDPFDHTIVRAEYQPARGNILLTSMPTLVEPYGRCAANQVELERWFEHVLAHEACHVLQHRADPMMLNPGNAGAVAAGLGAAAVKSGTPGDYLVYVGHAVETEAHGTQMAVQVRRLDADVTDRADFQELCASTSLWSHVMRRSAGGPQPDPTFDAMRTAVLGALVNEAWTAYGLLR